MKQCHNVVYFHPHANFHDVAQVRLATMQALPFPFRRIICINGGPGDQASEMCIYICTCIFVHTGVFNFNKIHTIQINL